MTIVTVIGARPQFVKAAALSKALADSPFDEFLIHTGQHYDEKMSDVFFTELGIPQPDVNLNVGSGSHGTQTARMIEGIEQVLLEQKPAMVILYGDTNSTVAGALAASKLHIPVAHVEAGLRSYNRRMPEEINRVVTDAISDLLLPPNAASAKTLENEAAIGKIEIVGDLMHEVLLGAATTASSPQIDGLPDFTPGSYIATTIHRAENTDVPDRLHAIADALTSLDKPVIFPVHPRTRKTFADLGIDFTGTSVHLVDPLPYSGMVGLMKNADVILTDSGGMQKEAYWLRIPCITVRDQTEWTETVDSGWNQLVAPDKNAILEATRSAPRPDAHPDFYGPPDAAHRIRAALSDFLSPE
ncbi:MAG: UDP-N-acetylglucosamine 2-epimerase (non-hydrolyzing) [Verrucomicrobiales bacterium]|nr:UDP-N-acetylglucosamine 2-epimerase (non-hydrolyzing) [Verrucomicrobiales bacterium]